MEYCQIMNQNPLLPATRTTVSPGWRSALMNATLISAALNAANKLRAISGNGSMAERLTRMSIVDSELSSICADNKLQMPPEATLAPPKGHGTSPTPSPASSSIPRTWCAKCDVSWLGFEHATHTGFFWETWKAFVNFSFCVGFMFLGCICNSIAATVDRSTRILDSDTMFEATSCALANATFAALLVASPASDIAFAARSFEFATSKPESIVIASAHKTSMAIPTINHLQPRSISALYLATISPKMSFLNVSGGRSASALFSIQSPQKTTRPPIEANINSNRNHGDEMSFTIKFIYSVLFCLPFLIILISTMAIIWRFRPSRRR